MIHSDVVVNLYGMLLVAVTKCSQLNTYHRRKRNKSMIQDNSKQEAAGFYLVARRAYGHGCIAIPVKPGNALAEFVSLLNEETAGTDIHIIGISRPAAYGEYAPYTILDSVSSFRDAVSAMKTANTVESSASNGVINSAEC